MNKNRIIVTTLAAAMAFGTPFAPVNTLTAKAATYTAEGTTDTTQTETPAAAVKELTVNYTNEISALNTYTSNTEDVYKDFANEWERKMGSFGYTYKFTLEKPSYVSINAMARVFSTAKTGNYQLILGNSESAINVKLSKETADGSKGTSYTTALEAGTYFIKLELNKTADEGEDTHDFLQNASASIGVAAQQMAERTGNVKGDSMAAAIPAQKGVIANGAITGVSTDSTIDFANVPQQYFKIELPEDVTSLTVSSVIRRCGNLSVAGDAKMTLTDDMGKTVQEADNKAGGNSMEISTGALKKGTYYAKVSYPEFCEITLKQDYTVPAPVQNTPQTPSGNNGNGTGATAAAATTQTTTSTAKKTAKNTKKTIKTLKITGKLNSKKLTVKTIKGATVRVKMGKKTYKGKANAKGKAVVKTAKLKKGLKFKVTVSKSGYKTKSKTCKISR